MRVFRASDNFRFRRYGPSASHSFEPHSNVQHDFPDAKKNPRALPFSSGVKVGLWAKCFCCFKYDCFLTFANIFLLVCLILLFCFGYKVKEFSSPLRSSLEDISPSAHNLENQNSKRNTSIFNGFNTSSLADFLLTEKYHSLFTDEELRENSQLLLDFLSLRVWVRSFHESNQSSLLELASFFLKSSEDRDALITCPKRERERGHDIISDFHLINFQLDANVFGSIIFGNETNRTFHWNKDRSDVRLLLRLCPIISSAFKCIDGVFFRASGHFIEEVEQHFPTDDISFLKFRYRAQIELKEALKNFTMQATESTGTSTVLPDSFLVADHRQRQKLLEKAYQGSSILNRRFYYPLRRYTKIHGYSPLSVAETSAWRAAVNLFYGENNTKYSFSVSPLRHTYAIGIENTMKNPTRSLLPELSLIGGDFDTKTIFVSVASYRDRECAPTLLDGFKRAKNPFRLYFGVAEQNMPPDFRGHGKFSPSDASCVGQEFLLPLPIFQPSLGEEEILPDFSCDQSNMVCWSTEANWRQKEKESLNKRFFSSFSFSGTAFAENVSSSYTSKPQEPYIGKENHSSVPRENLISHVRGFLVPEEHIRIRKIDAKNAKGPTFGRFMAMLLYRGEDFILVIDSHHRFVPHWDVMATFWFGQYNDRRAVLSHYPEQYITGPSFQLERDTTSYLCNASFLGNAGYVVLSAIIASRLENFAKNNYYNAPYTPISMHSKKSDSTAFLNGIFRLPQPWVAGGFLFTSSLMLREVPFDPHLSYLFQGEEVLFGVRLWTHGYNLYSPPRNLAYHFYTRSDAPKIWSDSSQLFYSLEPLARKRVQYLLRSYQDPEKSVQGALIVRDEVEGTISSSDKNWTSEVHFFRCHEEHYFLSLIFKENLQAWRNFSSVGENKQFSEDTFDFCPPLAYSQTKEWLSSSFNATKSTINNTYSLDFPYSSESELDSFVKVDLLRYGLGKKRTLSEWYEYSGVNPVKQSFDRRWCSGW